MRIRKNAKLSELLYANSNLSTNADKCIVQKSICQLNQSPWDIITFPPSDSSSSFHQVDDTEVYYVVNFTGNGSSTDSIADFESVASKTSELCENDHINHRNGRDSDNYDEIMGFKEEGEMSDQIQDQEIKLCDKRDKNGWQCGTLVKNGNIMCDYHLSKLQKQAVWTTKKKSGPGSGSGLTGGARPRRVKKRPTSNPHEFYYYSGFGPSWGKKRGTVGTISNGDNKASNDGDMCVEEETGKRFEPVIANLGPAELGYFDDDDEEDDDREMTGIIGKKRGRKPVKERSLKSLM